MERDYSDTEHERFANAVRWIAESTCEMLILKNKQYGNSALNPIRVFARGVGLRDQLNVRLDDKLSRIQLGDPATEDEDVEADILGYLILKAVAKLMDEGNEGILNGTTQFPRGVSEREPVSDELLLGEMRTAPGWMCECGHEHQNHEAVPEEGIPGTDYDVSQYDYPGACADCPCPRYRPVKGIVRQ